MDILPITKGIVMLTNTCNLNCKYCFEHNLTPQHMDLQTAKDVLNYFESNCTPGQNPRFVFFGGEPLLRFDPVIVPLVEYSKGLKHKVNFSMTTNGTLLNSDKIRFLRDNNVRIMLSCDGIREIQEEGRPMKNGKSSYEAVMSQIMNAKGLNLLYTARGTITKASLGRMFETIQMWERLGTPTLHLLPDLWEEWGEKEEEILSKQLLQYEDYILKMYRTEKRPLLFSDYRMGFWRINSALYSKERRINTVNLPKARCGMGVRGSCSITPTGDMYGCHHIAPLTRDSDWYIGNIYDGLDIKRVEKLISLYDKDSIGNEMCSSCPLDNICDGGCTSTNIMVTGNVNKVPKTFCIWKRAITDSAYKISVILGKEENSLFKRDFLRWCQ